MELYHKVIYQTFTPIFFFKLLIYPNSDFLEFIMDNI